MIKKKKEAIARQCTHSCFFREEIKTKSVVYARKWRYYVWIEKKKKRRGYAVKRVRKQKEQKYHRVRVINNLRQHWRKKKKRVGLKLVKTFKNKEEAALTLLSSACFLQHIWVRPAVSFFFFLHLNAHILVPFFFLLLFLLQSHSEEKKKSLAGK